MIMHANEVETKKKKITWDKKLTVTYVRGGEGAYLKGVIIWQIIYTLHRDRYKWN